MIGAVEPGKYDRASHGDPKGADLSRFTAIGRPSLGALFAFDKLDAEDAVSFRQRAGGERAGIFVARNIGDLRELASAAVQAGLGIEFAQTYLVAHGKLAIRVAAQLMALGARDNGGKEVGPRLELMDPHRLSSHSFYYFSAQARPPVSKGRFGEAPRACC